LPFVGKGGLVIEGRRARHSPIVFKPAEKPPGAALGPNPSSAYATEQDRHGAVGELEGAFAMADQFRQERKNGASRKLLTRQSAVPKVLRMSLSFSGHARAE